ncbi:MAG: putative baseplate assembly protein [Acidobacteriota bacterium]|nr:putative baseplate assembly protein [Acidobacteriota bacterium]
MSDLDRLRTRCSCCDGLAHRTPVVIDNRPGLAALDYRVGTHGRFKASMLSGVSGHPALRSLTTRRDDDLTVALLDGWATLLDVLTFYQERLANEGYLRTAAERRSLLELARAIGYELRPGVAAGTYLAFDADDSEGSPPEAFIPVGTRAQSIPGQDELPQSFETVEVITARADWNALLPRQKETQWIQGPIRELAFQGTGLGLEAGQRLLAVQGDQREALRVMTVREIQPPPASQDAGRTEVTVLPVDPSGTVINPAYLGVPVAWNPPPSGPLPFDHANVSTHITSQGSWTGAELAARLERLGWNETQLADYLDERPRPGPSTALEIYALPLKASFFGHNAPRWGSLPEDWRNRRKNPAAPYPRRWREGHRQDINRRSQGGFIDSSERVVYLDQGQPKILPGSWVVFEEASTSTARGYKVESVNEQSHSDFGLSGKATRLKLDTKSGLAIFEFRTATAYGASQRLELAEVPVEDDVEGLSVDLDGYALGLENGQRVALTGERADLPGVEETEVRVLAEVRHVMTRGITRLQFTEELEHRYLRTTVTLNANLARATHGESRREVLGSGDASQPFQRFALKHKPLTYTSAATASGGESTLEVRVNGVRWHESPDLYRLGARDRSYVLRREDDGTTRVLFGDGRRGARLPTGVENITAVYRSGIGLGGHLDAGRISMLATRPLGVTGVTNPVPARGAEDPESRDGARRNAPLTVLTLDRIVSLEDFQSFARSFSGVGKARSDWLWDGRQRVVHVTIASADGTVLEEDAELLTTLREAMNGLRDPFQPLVISPFEGLVFATRLRVKVHADHLPEVVHGAVREALEEGFSFSARELVQPVAASDVVAAAQGVPGVVAVDLEDLRHDPPLSGPSGGLGGGGRLLALPARLGTAVPGAGERPILGAQLLTLAPQGITLEEMP